MRFELGRGRRGFARLVGLGTVGAVTALAVGSAVSAQPQAGPDRTAGRALPHSVAALKLATPEATTAATSHFLRPGVGVPDAGRVIVRLSAESGAEAFVHGKSESDAKAAAHAQQDAFISRVHVIDPNARVIARVQLVLNAVFVEVDASKLSEIAKDPAVVRIAPVGNYEMDLSRDGSVHRSEGRAGRRRHAGRASRSPSSTPGSTTRMPRSAAAARQRMPRTIRQSSSPGRSRLRRSRVASTSSAVPGFQV